jgi:hypothetical protein
MRLSGTSAGVLLAVFLAGCSAEGQMTVHSSAAATNLPANPSLRLVVNAVAPDSTDQLLDIRAAIFSQLSATGQYSKVVLDNEPTDLVMTVDITKYAKVSVGERLLVGALAGRNRVGGEVTVTQTATNAVLKTFEADGSSAAHPLSSESGMSDAVRELAKQVASVPAV